MKRALAVSLLIGSSPAHADRRLFTSTFEYQTVPEGATTLELWHTQARSSWDDDDPGAATLLENRLEIEHGLTEHWDAGLFLVFTQLASDDPAITSQSYAFEALELETRYRFADRSEWPVDIVAYGAVAKQFGASVYDLEARGIFARGFDKVTAAANVIGLVQIDDEPMGETELDVGWAAGLTYEVHPKLNLGVESYGTIELDDGGVVASVGPAIAVAPSSNLWLALTTSFGFDDAPAFTGRLILGIEL